MNHFTSVVVYIDSDKSRDNIMISISKHSSFASKLEKNDKFIKEIQDALKLLEESFEEFTVVEPSENSKVWLFKVKVNSKSYEFKVAVDEERKSDDEMFMEDALAAMIKLCTPEKKSTKATCLKLFAAFTGLVSVAKASGMPNMLFSGFGGISAGDAGESALRAATARALQPYPEIYDQTANVSTHDLTNFTSANSAVQNSTVEYVPDSFTVIVDTKKLKGGKLHKGKHLGTLEKSGIAMHRLNKKEFDELQTTNSSAIVSKSPVTVVHLDPGENVGPGRNLATASFNTLDFFDEVPMSGAVEFEQPVPDIPGILYVLDTGGTPDPGEFGNRYQKAISFVGDDGIDLHSHGTHVASSAVGNRFGVSKHSLIQPVKVLNDNGFGTSDAIVAGIIGSINDYQQRIKKGQKCKPIMNISISGTPDPAYRDAIKAAVDAGFLIVIAAGNYGSDACNYIGGALSDIPGVVVVANIDKQGARWPTSNYGKCVTLWQNGVNVEALTGL